MKLPFKIPSIKLPKLPKFGKKKADDDEDDEDFEGLDDLGDLGDLDDKDDAGDEDAPDAAADDGDGEAAPEESVAEEPPAESDSPAEGGADSDGADSDDMDEEIPDFGDDDDDDDEDEEGGGAKKKRLMMIGGGVLVLLLAGGGGWYFMSGDDMGDEAGASKPREGVDPDVPRVEMAIAPKKRRGGGLNAIAAGVTGPGAGVSVAAVSEGAFASFAPPVGDDVALAAATDPSLIEQTPQGPLPKIAEDGRKPWQVYARPFKTAAGERRLGLIVSGLGLSIAATDAAIRLLPGSVTLAFDPYADGLEDWAAKARQAGHEVLMMMPLESNKFPYEDPGPKALTTTNDPDENRFRLEFVLSRMSGYVGVLTTMGSKFAESDEHLRVFLEEINRRGLILVEGKNEASTLATTVAAEIGLPRVAVDVVLDDIPSKQSIDRSFGEIEEVIASGSVGVGVAEPYPASIERIIAWQTALKDKKVVLAPITAIVGRQPTK
ncbi:MAG: divergent polysaccharide deacetylase family protein [Alphaproteobacteria bacterium]